MLLGIDTGNHVPDNAIPQPKDVTGVCRISMNDSV